MRQRKKACNYASLLFLFLFILHFLQNLHHVPVEFQFRPIDHVDFLVGQYLPVFLDVLLLQVEYVGFGIQELVDDCIIFFFRGSGVLGLFGLRPSLIVQGILLVLLFKVNREEFLGLVGGQSRFFGHVDLLLASEILLIVFVLFLCKHR